MITYVEFIFFFGIIFLIGVIVYLDRQLVKHQRMVMVLSMTLRDVATGTIAVKPDGRGGIRIYKDGAPINDW